MDLTEKIKEDIRKRKNQPGTRFPVSTEVKDRRLSINQLVHNATVQEPRQPRPITYQDIASVVKDINITQREFERMKRRADSQGFESYLLKAGDYLAKKLNVHNKVHTDVELFEKQITNVDRLNHMLAALVVYGKNTLDRVGKRVDEIIYESEKYHKDKGSLEGEIPGLAEKYRHVKEKFDSMDKSEKEYFQTQREMIQLERDLDEKKGQYNRTMQRDIGTSRHKDSVIYMEKLFRVYLNTASELAVVTEQIKNTLIDNKTVYEGCNTLVEASAAVSGGLDVLADYNRQLTQRFVSGIQTMQEMIYSNDNTRMIDDSNRSLKKLIDEVKDVDYRQHLQLEASAAGR